MTVPTPQRILLVDDEPDVLDFLGYNLRLEGYQVETATNGLDALRIAQRFKPHLVILDVMMPGMDGIETCERLRSIKEFENVMIAFLTARGEDYSQVAGFKAGADDYIAKPVKPKVLIIRIQALLKRVKEEPPQQVRPTITVGDVEIDPDRYQVRIGDQLWQLPRKEFELLHLLVSRPDKVFSREEIYRAVWGDEVVVGDRTIDVHIRKLREKIGESRIGTLKGVGYRFVSDQKEQ